MVYIYLLAQPFSCAIGLTRLKLVSKRTLSSNIEEFGLPKSMDIILYSKLEPRSTGIIHIGNMEVEPFGPTVKVAVKLAFLESTQAVVGARTLNVFSHELQRHSWNSAEPWPLHRLRL
jgi:hypothetical protein